MRKLAMAVLIAGAMSTQAQATEHYFGVSANYGLGGFGVDLGYAIVPDTLNIRAGYNHGHDFSGTFKSDGNKYNYDFDTGYKTLGLDWHPFNGSFRVSAGYAWSDVDFSLDAKGIKIDGKTIAPNEFAKAKITYDNAPYLSLGWGNHAPAKGGLFFNSELGVIFTGDANVKLSTNSNAVTQAEIDREARKIRKDAPDLFPIVKLGVGYAF